VNHRNFERILRLLATSSTSVSGTVPNNLNTRHNVSSTLCKQARKESGLWMENERHGSETDVSGGTSVEIQGRGES
jgi:hypothetical protein